MVDRSDQEVSTDLDHHPGPDPVWLAAVHEVDVVPLDETSSEYARVQWYTRKTPGGTYKYSDTEICEILYAILRSLSLVVIYGER